MAVESQSGQHTLVVDRATGFPPAPSDGSNELPVRAEHPHPKRPGAVERRQSQVRFEPSPARGCETKIFAATACLSLTPRFNGVLPRRRVVATASAVSCAQNSRCRGGHCGLWATMPGRSMDCQRGKSDSSKPGTRRDLRRFRPPPDISHSF